VLVVLAVAISVIGIALRLSVWPDVVIHDGAHRLLSGIGLLLAAAPRLSRIRTLVLVDGDTSLIWRIIVLIRIRQCSEAILPSARR
jgi:Na+/H+-dicarboxylate symporter